VNDIKEHLDKLITHWRQERAKSVASYGINIQKIYDEGNFDQLPPKVFMAVCYIDAYQSIRSTLFGETLKDEYGVEKESD